jgi:hypothetical protein
MKDGQIDAFAGLPGRLHHGAHMVYSKNAASNAALKPRQQKPISRAARQDIAVRKAKSRPVILDELTRLIRSRSGEATEQQLAVVASIMSLRVECAAYLQPAVRTWVWQCGAPKGSEKAFFASAGWAEAWSRAQDAEYGKRRSLTPADSPDGPRRSVDPRKDYSIPAIRSAFGITADEESELDLRQLVSERRRSALRRRAEGLPKAGTPTPIAADRAAESGVSRRTLFRRAQRERTAAAEEAVTAVLRAASGDTTPIEPDRKLWVKAGVSRAAWYRRKDRETQSGTLRDRNKVMSKTVDEYPSLRPLLLSSYDTVAKSATLCLTPPAPTAPIFRTAESRRLAVLAHRLGLEWTGARYLVAWWAVPTGMTLSEADAADLHAAVQAADAADNRCTAIENARARDADQADTRTYEQRQTDEAAERAEAQAAHDRGDCPAKVNTAVWTAVPAELRRRVRRLAGRFFLLGSEPDEAVADAVELIRRANAIVARVQSSDHSADLDRVQALAENYYELSTTNAVGRVLNDIAKERAALAASPPDPREADLKRMCRREHPGMPIDQMFAACQEILREPDHAEHARQYGFGTAVLSAAEKLRKAGVREKSLSDVIKAAAQS